MSQLSDLATHLALSPTVPPKVRCKALDILYALGQEAPRLLDPDPDLENVRRRLAPHGPPPFSVEGPPEMPPSLVDQFEAGLLGGPPGAWADAITPPEVK